MSGLAVGFLWELKNIANEQMALPDSMSTSLSRAAWLPFFW